MDKREQLKSQYTTVLMGMLDEYKEKVSYYFNNDRLDESNLVKIKINVVDIFLRMFQISFDKTKNQNEDLLKAYMKLLTKIKSPWEANKLKAIQFEDEVTSIIEEIKINQAEELILIFNKIHSELMKGE